MAQINEIRNMFKDIDGFEIINDEKGNIKDINLPPSCDIISKTVVEGEVKSIQFYYNDALYTYES